MGYFLAGGLLTGGLVFLYFLNPSETKFFPPCPFRLATGWYCPGCGSLRAIHNLLHGRLMAALSLNLLMVVSIPVVAAMLLKPAWIYKRWVPWAALCILIAYGVLRNVPAWPFCLLAP